MPEYHYWKCCCNFPTVGPKYHGLMDMIDDGIDITRRTFIQYVDQEELKIMARNMGYSDHHTQGLTMAADWSISYHRSKYRGVRVYYFQWSRIEHIFVPRGFNENH